LRRKTQGIAPPAPERDRRSRHREPGERVNAELKNWRVPPKIRSSPNTADTFIAAVQTLMIANA
jgi:hypothetical protein